VVGGFSPLRGFIHEDDTQRCGDRATAPSSGLLFGLADLLDYRVRAITVGNRAVLTYPGPGTWL